MKRVALALTLAAGLSPAGAEAAWTEAPIEAATSEGPLAGTLVDTPGAADPVVLIVPGSGPTDRDGNNPLGVSAAPYRMLAHALADRGISSVRIDKRGMFGSAAASANPNGVTVGDHASDLRIWIEAIRRQTGAQCVWLLGHSEGGLIALTTAAASEPVPICGLLLVATPGQRLSDLVRDQLRANPANAPILAEAEHGIDELEAGRHIAASGISPPLLPLLGPQVQDYLIDLFQRDPTALARRIALPMLLLYGGRDLQVPPAEGRLIAAAAPAAEMVVIETANHVLKSVASDDRTANLATYADPSLPLAAGVAESIATFVKAHSPAG